MLQKLYVSAAAGPLSPSLLRRKSGHEAEVGSTFLLRSALSSQSPSYRLNSNPSSRPSSAILSQFRVLKAISMFRRELDSVSEGLGDGHETKVVNVHEDQEMGSDGNDIARIERVYK